MLGWLSDVFASAQQWLFEALVQPIVFALGMGNLVEDAFTATGWLLVGLLQIAVLVAVIGPLQRWRPVEPITDRAEIRTDILYTLVHRLGLFRVLLFFALEPFFDDGFGWLRVMGLSTFHLDDMLGSLWPGVTDLPLASFLMYLVVFDFVDYWIHRGQHGFNWWWSLHALHHSQRQMTMWSDNRNHLLDSVITDVIFVVVAILIGVGPSQFVALVAVTQLLESLQHANLRWSWGRVGSRLLVSPSFHRRHHAVALGHEPGSTVRDPYGENFGVLFPWWDMLFGSADWRPGLEPTGINDQLAGRDYGRGFWRQQWLGLKRLVGADRPRRAVL